MPSQSSIEQSTHRVDIWPFPREDFLFQTRIPEANEHTGHYHRHGAMASSSAMKP